METTEELKIDKSSWGPGPWQDEPDRVDFVHAGFACFVHRNENGGFYCGYVGVPREHPAYGKDYDAVGVDVHGGLTYARECDGVLCHVPQPGMPDQVWWLGFDCAHLGDLAPGMEATTRALHERHPELGPYRLDRRPQEYRDLAYVRRETEKLAEQLAAMKTGELVS